MHCELSARRRPPHTEEKEEKEEQLPPSEELKAACAALCDDVDGCAGWYAHANTHCHTLSTLDQIAIRDDSYTRSCFGAENS